MPESQNGLSAETEEAGSNGSDDEYAGMRGSPRWSRVSSGTKGWRLRGVEWRVKLNVLPGSPASVDAMRRATADGRRRYAELRRRLLVDPHIMDDDQEPSHSMDNPLSLDPESVWGRYFRNAELEKTIDKDLTRLYPEHGIFFQSASCQAMMRRILLVWSLIHPQISYRQGMHELLAPLLYVLHVDVVRLSQVKNRFEDLFDDRFDSLSLQEEHVRDKVETAKKFVGEMIIAGDSINFDEKGHSTVESAADPDEERVDLSVIVQGSDMYGVEGELGALLSTRFLEHDAYCMLDALLSGQGGAVAMADYFRSSTGVGVPPVIEASASLYRTLAAADLSLYTHLLDLGVEPQFFALRWLRLLFGREFVLEDLLRVWDAIFTADNTPLFEDDDTSSLKFSLRSALISSFAVSMLLYVRPALLAAPDSTACLQRLFGTFQVPDIRNLIDSAKSLQPLAQAAEKAPTPMSSRINRALEISRNVKHIRSGSISPPTTQHHVVRVQKSNSCSPEVLRVSMSLPGSYWEEKWTHSVLLKKTPEELFSPGASKLESVMQGHGSGEKDGPTASGMSSRGVLEGRYHMTQDGPLTKLVPASALVETLPNSEVDGREMLRRTGKAANKPGGSKDSSVESVSSTSDSDGSCESSHFQVKELVDHFGELTNELNTGVSLPGVSLELSHDDRSLKGETSSSPQEKLLPHLDSLDSCSKSDKEGFVKSDESGGEKVHFNGPENSSEISEQLGSSQSMVRSCKSSSISCNQEVPLSTSFVSGMPLKVDNSPTSSASYSHGSEREAAGLSLEKNVCELPLHDSSSKLNSTSASTSHLRLEIVSGASCENHELNLNSPDAESTCDQPTSSGEYATEDQSPDQKGNEDISGVVDNSLQSKFCDRSVSTPTRLGRLNWMWSLGRGSFGERTAPNVVIPNGNGSVSDGDVTNSPIANGVPRKKKSWWRSNADIVPEECTESVSHDPTIVSESATDLPKVDTVKIPEEVVASIGVAQKEGMAVEAAVISPEIAKKPKDMTPSAALQALGQSMLDHIQILESSLAQKASVLGMEGMMWTPAVREKSEGNNRTSLGGKGQAAAFAAIAELRKISNALQQM